MKVIFDCQVNNSEHLEFRTNEYEKDLLVQMYKDTDVLTDYLKECKIICLNKEQVLDLIAFLNGCLQELE